jgi:hypothetical protein
LGEQLRCSSCVTEDVQMPRNIRRHPEFLRDPLAGHHLVVNDVIKGCRRFVWTDRTSMQDLNLA